jgi:capsular exopolysaccharide synthesis family protein
LRTTINSAEEVERLTGGVPVGIVPFDPNIGKHPLVTSEQAIGRAEAFRALRTNLQFADVDHPPRVIVITSPLPGEGKTTSAVNIALTIALTGARVALLEGDLRRPSIAAHLGLSNAVGLTNVLAGQCELSEVMITRERGTLSILTSGPTPPNPSELLGSQQMSELIGVLANNFDIVVIDAPPLLPVTDAAILTAVSDGALLIVRHGKTRREEVVQAIQTLEAVSARLLGTVLNGTPAAKTRTSAGYGDGTFGSDGGNGSGFRDQAEPVTSGAMYAQGKGPSRHG